MSFNTQPTRIHDLVINSDQTYLSGNTLDASAAAFQPQQDTDVASVDSTSLADGEFRVLTDASSSSATLAYRSGGTTYEWATLGQVR